MTFRNTKAQNINCRKYKIASKKSEANLTAKLLISLQQHGINAECEVRFYDITEKKRKLVAIFDVVVFDEAGNIKIIIECKRGKNGKGLKSQLEKYRKFGYEVITCLGWKNIPSCVDYCLGLPYHFYNR